MLSSANKAPALRPRLIKNCSRDGKSASAAIFILDYDFLNLRIGDRWR